MRWSRELTYEKDPSDVLDYVLDFGGLLGADTINTATIAGTDVTIDSNSITGNKVTIFVSGGTAGKSGTVQTTIVTNNSKPRTFERTFTIQVRDL